LNGDFVSHAGHQAIELQPLAELAQQIPTYAVLGNHDYALGKPKDRPDEDTAQAINSLLTACGVTVLKNEGASTHGLWLAGIDEIWTKRADIDQSLKQRSPGAPTILLAHNPDAVMNIKKEQGIDLVLCGHTHGGQVRLPVLGPVGAIPNQLGRAFAKGWHTYQGTRFFVSSGIGESGTRARLFNPPELVLLTLRF
jgi:hypothetical protein